MYKWRKGRKAENIYILSPRIAVPNIHYLCEDMIIKNNNAISFTFRYVANRDTDYLLIQDIIKRYFKERGINKNIAIVEESRISPTTGRTITPIKITYKHQHLLEPGDLYKIMQDIVGRIDEIYNDNNSSTFSNKLCHDKTDSNK